MLRVLCRLERDQDFDGDIHGKSGPVPIARWRRDELLPPQQAFLDAVTGQGIPWVDDLNAPDASGIGAIPMNREDGLRMSTALTYLPLARGRKNLTIRARTQVARVLVEDGRAAGVEVRAALSGGTGVERVSGDRIVVCAGAVHTPALLLRSGIGPAAHLRDVGVDCLVELRGVGENLMDHQGTAVFLVPNGELPAPDIRICQLGARYSSSAGGAKDDMWLSMWGSWELAAFPEMQQALGGAASITALVVGVHDPRSRGTVRLRTTDAAVAPQVDFGMLRDPVDMERLVEGLQLAIELATSPSFAESYKGIGLIDPSAASDRAVLEGYIASTVGGWFHASGTCRMGRDPDDGAVVDGRLRVHGVEGLYVADASVMPTVVRAPTNLSSIAIGERAAELLR
jgi:choline dehydrogenase